MKELIRKISRNSYSSEKLDAVVKNYCEGNLKTIIGILELIFSI